MSTHDSSHPAGPLASAPERPPAPDDRSAGREDVPRRVWTSAGWLVGGRLVGSACTFLILLVLAGHLEDAAFGRLTFWLAAFLVLDGIVDFGAGQVALQRAARDPGAAGAVLRTARRARLMTGGLVVSAVVAIALALERDDGPYLAVAALYQLSHVLELSTLGWRDRIAWRSPVLVRAGAALASLAFVLALRATGEARPMPYLLAIAVGSTLGNAALHGFGRRGLPSTRGVAAAPIAPFLAASIPMGAAAVCQQLYFHVDNVFVRVLAGDDVVGRYNVAVRVMSLAIMGGVLAASAALPWLARAHARGALRSAALRLTAASTLLGAAGVAVLFPFRATILGLFGEEFRVAAPTLAWLLVAAFAVHVGAPLLTSVVAAGRSRTVLVLAAAGLVVNVVGNAWLVPQMGMDGAAIATLGTEAFIAAGAAWAVVRIDRRDASSWREM
ncbi:MAG: oligosaccharide flippase family protein [Planctomycetota bacterium]